VKALGAALAASGLVVCGLAASCRTGADGDPWARETADSTATQDAPETDESQSDDERRDDEAPISRDREDEPELTTDPETNDGATADDTEDSYPDDGESSTPPSGASTREMADIEEPGTRDEDAQPVTGMDLVDASVPGSDLEPTDTGQPPEVEPETDLDTDTHTEVTPDDEATPEPMDAGDIVDEEPPCVPEDHWESCDQRDNNCDGNIDEGYVCPPEPGVVGALPFAGGVYLVGTTAKGQAGATALQRFWPSVDPTYINGFGNYDDDFSVRRSDTQLFFADLDGVVGRIDGRVQMPECLQFAVSRYDFDANETLYYVCRGELLRGQAEPVVTEVTELVGVTDDGRAVVVRSGEGLGHWAQASGFVPLDLQIFGTLSYVASSVQGNTVVAAFARQLEESEVIVLKLDESSNWSVMRRVAVEPFAGTWEVLVDGTLMLHQVDPEDTRYRRIVALLPDGTEQIAWREAESTEVVIHGSSSMFTGPLEPGVLDGE
jgi:hypothetical protein